MKLQYAAAILALNFAASGLGAGPSTTILESALLNSSNSGPSYSLDFLQYQGCRFHVSQATLVDHIGGDLNNGGSDNSMIFGAIASLSSPNGFPALSPSDFQPLAVTMFTATSFNGDQLIPLSVLLSPGDYALIFGSGRFGATGKAGMRGRNTETSQASYFQGAFPSIFASHWEDYSGLHNMRFLVFGTTIPEPTTRLFVSIAIFASLANRRRK